MAGVLKQLVVVAALGAAAYGGWLHLGAREGAAAGPGGPERPPPAVVVEPARLERVERTVSAVGTGLALQSVELATLSEGRVVAVGFEGGETVPEGAVLLRLEDAEERASLAEAEAERARAEAAFARSSTLQAQGRVADTAFETAEAELRVAEAAVERARKALDDRTLRAPFSGVTGFRRVDVGAVVDANTPVGAIEDISALNVDFAIPERFFGEVAVGAPVRATTEAFPGLALDGAVTGVGRSVDPVSRSFTARARVPNPDMRLPSGLFMRVTLVLEAREGVTVPEEAVVAEGDRFFVFVVREERAERREVALGERRPGRVEILSGVAEGEELVTRGVQKTVDGRPVRVLAPEANAAAPGA